MVRGETALVRAAAEREANPPWVILPKPLRRRHTTGRAQTIRWITTAIYRRRRALHRKLAIITVLAVLGVIGAGTAFAGKPADPGCFGTDRAAYVETVALPDTTAPGASEVGHILADRAAANGEINRD
jgi:hypothetical protein